MNKNYTPELLRWNLNMFSPGRGDSFWKPIILRFHVGFSGEILWMFFFMAEVPPPNYHETPGSFWWQADKKKGKWWKCLVFSCLFSIKTTKSQGQMVHLKYSSHPSLVRMSPEFDPKKSIKIESEDLFISTTAVNRQPEGYKYTYTPGDGHWDSGGPTKRSEFRRRNMKFQMAPLVFGYDSLHLSRRTDVTDLKQPPSCSQRIHSWTSWCQNHAFCRAGTGARCFFYLARSLPLQSLIHLHEVPALLSFRLGTPSSKIPLVSWQNEKPYQCDFENQYAPSTRPHSSRSWALPPCCFHVSWPLTPVGRFRLEIEPSPKSPMFQITPA